MPVDSSVVEGMDADPLALLNRLAVMPLMSKILDRLVEDEVDMWFAFSSAWASDGRGTGTALRAFCALAAASYSPLCEAPVCKIGAVDTAMPTCPDRTAVLSDENCGWVPCCCSTCCATGGGGAGGGGWGCEKCCTNCCP